jgi:hypothetical protein
MDEVALKLIRKFGDKLNPGQISYGFTALSWACTRDMPNVMFELFKIYKPSQSEIKKIIQNIDHITGADIQKQILDYLDNTKNKDALDV